MKIVQYLEKKKQSAEVTMLEPCLLFYTLNVSSNQDNLFKKLNLRPPNPTTPLALKNKSSDLDTTLFH
jgi:hypothetical protein